MKKVVVIPSWYSDEPDNNTGSFFREQTTLMSQGYEMKVLHFEKNWISWRRAVYEKLTGGHSKLVPLQHTPPEGYVLRYNFVKHFTQAANHALLLREFEIGFDSYIDLNGKPDLIHAQCTFLAGIIAQHLSEKFDIPYIITEHYGPFQLSEFDSFYHEMIKKALENADKVLAVSEHQRKSILGNKINCDPIVVGNLVDDELFILKKETRKCDITRLLYVTFYPSYIKNTGLFFDTLEELKTRGFAFEATIIGGKSGSEFGPDYYSTEISKRNLSAHCHLIPEASRSEMVIAMQNTDIYISTSIAESFGITACEALLCGTPYVSTKNGGISDFHSPEFGELVEISNAVGTVSAIQAVRSRLTHFPKKEMRASISEKYGKEAFFQRIDTIYHSVLKERN